MKVLLLCPSFYTLDKTIKTGFERLNYQLYHHDYRKFITGWQQQVNTQIYRLPNKYREKWENHYFPLINKKHIEVFEQEKPDVVFIYNNEMLLPETIKYIKSKNAKIIFLLGDSPYYTPTNKYYLHLLFFADLIVSPDSMWAEQLSLLGIKKITLDFPGFDDTLMSFREPTQKEKSEYNFDVFFVGTGYPDLWGYKRTLFLSKFANLNLKVFGTKHWLKWLEFFPELKPKFELQRGKISDEQLIIISKCAKVYPVDANPAILNGVHLRVFDCIAHGVLPLVEYRKDHDKFFSGTELPVIKNYDEAEKIAMRYIENDELRIKTLSDLRTFVKENYKPEKVLNRIIANVL